MRIVWRVEDGYVNNGEHETEVPDEDLAGCSTEKERENLIDEYVDDDFVNNVSFEIVRKEKSCE